MIEENLKNSKMFHVRNFFWCWYRQPAIKFTQNGVNTISILSYLDDVATFAN